MLSCLLSFKEMSLHEVRGKSHNNGAFSNYMSVRESSDIFVVSGPSWSTLEGSRLASVVSGKYPN